MGGLQFYSLRYKLYDFGTFLWKKAGKGLKKSIENSLKNAGKTDGKKLGKFAGKSLENSQEKAESLMDTLVEHFYIIGNCPTVELPNLLYNSGNIFMKIHCASLIVI